jgi:glycosyltransferase involved in cell wall biosynthesis
MLRGVGHDDRDLGLMLVSLSASATSRGYIPLCSLERSVIRRLRSFIHTTLGGHRVEPGPLQALDSPLLIGLVRERNEALILRDTLDHLARLVDGIVLYDDASDDDSVAIARTHPKVLGIIVNKKWRNDRAKEETRNRSVLLEWARRYKPEWFLYCDADERFEGDMRQFLLSPDSENVDGIRISLFDAYMTEDDQTPYRKGEMYNLRQHFGPERRDILMIWRNRPAVHYGGVDAREPRGVPESRVVTRFYCQHYGKALSQEQWEETCEYYRQHFPAYSEKWAARRGKAIHTVSDFGNDLYDWNTVKQRGIRIHPT